MKTKDFTKIGEEILPALPGFMLKGQMILKSPLGDFLYALHFHGSTRDKINFYIYAFILPLFVPTEMVHFNYGKRLTRVGSRWNIEDPNLVNNLIEVIQAEGIPFFDRTSTIQSVAEFLQSMVTPNAMGYVNPHSQEALAYTLAKLNDMDGALIMLNQMQEKLIGSTISSELKIRDRILLFQQKISQDPKTAVQQLDIWKTETIRDLGLEKYC